MPGSSSKSPSGEEMLREAAETVATRMSTYGNPAPHFTMVARLWSAFLGVEITAYQVICCMQLLKIARLAESPGHPDSEMDIAGYVACLRYLPDDQS